MLKVPTIASPKNLNKNTIDMAIQTSAPLVIFIVYVRIKIPILNTSWHSWKYVACGIITNVLKLGIIQSSNTFTNLQCEVFGRRSR